MPKRDPKVGLRAWCGAGQDFVDRNQKAHNTRGVLSSEAIKLDEV